MRLAAHLQSRRFAPAASLPRRCSVRASTVQASGASWSDPNTQQTLLAFRASLLNDAPMALLTVKGVSFDGRQDAVRALTPGQGVQLARSPSNPFDPNAVEILNLAGEQLGFVSRLLTPAWPMTVCFGHVTFVGMAQGSEPPDLAGAQVQASPSLHGLVLDALPDSWAQAADPQAALGSDWQALQLAALARYGQRCAVSRVPAGVLPLSVVPLWGFDRHRKQVWLAELLPVCEPLLVLRQELLAMPVPALAPAGLSALTDSQPPRPQPQPQPQPDQGDSAPWDAAAGQRMVVAAAAAGGPAAAAAAGEPAGGATLSALQLLGSLMCWRPDDCARYVGAAQARKQWLATEGWALQPLSVADL